MKKLDTPVPVDLSADDLIDALVAGQLSANTRRAYQRDAIEFLEFIGIRQPTDLSSVATGQIELYRNRLMKAGAAKATVNRKLSVVRRLFERAMAEGWVSRNPATLVRGLRSDPESNTSGLTLRQARELLASIDVSELPGRRDHCLLFLMMRTGIRRSEAAGILMGDFEHREGHATLTIRGKGNKKRIAKISPEVLRCCREWMAASGRKPTPRTALFVALKKTRKGYAVASETPLTADSIWKIVLKRVREAELEAHITPHSLRHTFVTLALDGGAPLHKVQYAAGHADPRTTERYHRQKENLDDNAVDYVRI